MNVSDFYSDVLKRCEGSLRPVDVKVSADVSGAITQIQVTYKPMDAPVEIPNFLIKGGIFKNGMKI